MGNLNQEIRPMLANLVADNYATVDCIEWDKIVQHSEFLGHTEFTLSGVFFGAVMRSAESHYCKSRRDLTLKEIADYANEAYKHSNVSEAKKRRQLGVISHFERL